MKLRDLFRRREKTFNVGWDCGHTDTFTESVMPEILQRYTIDEYCPETNTYIINAPCPYCVNYFNLEQETEEE